MDIDIPDHWASILSQVQALGTNAFIAGGCLRDLVAGVEHKDIDVFVPMPRMGAEEGLSRLAARLAYGRRSPVVWEEYADWNPGVMGYVNVNMEGEDVQLIAVDRDDYPTPSSEIARHDFGATQIAYDGWSIYVSPAFRRDMEKKTFTLVRGGSTGDLRRSLECFERINPRYPGWSLVIAEGVSICGL